MTACLCEACQPDNPGPTYTEAFRHQCECRAVARMATNAERKAYLIGIEKRRGAEAAQTMRMDVWKLIRRKGEKRCRPQPK